MPVDPTSPVESDEFASNAESEGPLGVRVEAVTESIGGGGGGGGAAMATLKCANHADKNGWKDFAVCF